MPVFFIAHRYDVCVKRRLRIALGILTLSSLALLIATIVVWDLSWGETAEGDFRCGGLWHAALEPGVLHLNNKPQRSLEEKKIAGERRSLTQALDREPYGTPAYRTALAESRVFDAAAERRMAAIPLVERSISISKVMGGFALLPALWCGRGLFRKRRDFAGQIKGRFAIVLVVWFALCATIVVFWGRSNRPHYDELIYNKRAFADRSSAGVALRSLQGRVILICSKRTWDDQGVFDKETADAERSTPNGLSVYSDRYQTGPWKASFRRRLAFDFGWSSGRIPAQWGGSGTTSSAVVSVPHWFLLLLLTTPVAWTLRRRIRRARRIRAGLCGKCGYDLRESPLRCPECGTLARQEAVT
ncbi:MAG: hypothetical protein JWN40_4739 [Phycisphaerales bacterium]|nr:hypothetical protein [Phycisphaerales bacterium]